MTNSAASPPPGYRIAQVGIGTESSTFAPHRTGGDDFMVTRGEEVHANTGYLVEHRLPDFPQVEFVPLMDARAMPGGPVLPDAFDRLTGEMVDLLAANRPFDGVYLRLHGAVNVLGRLDAEAEFVRRVRAVVGDELLISASMDLHGQMSEALFRSVDVLTCYRTAPHIDYAETQERACRDLARYLTEGIRPVRALVRVPVLLPGEMTSTRLEPAASIYASLADDQHPQGVRDASLWVGYAWADEPRSAAATVVHGTDEEAVVAEAMRVGQAWFDARSRFVFCAPADEPDACIERALASDRRPFFVSDSGDNPTAGGSDDVAWFLGRLLANADLAAGRSAAIWASCVAADAVATCVEAGPGATVDLLVGGQFGGSDPVPVHGEVMSVHENERSGPIAVVRSGGVSAVLTTRRAAFHFVRQFTDLGLDPAAVDLVAVKIGYLEPDLFAAAADHLLALTPGGVNQKLTDLTYRQVVRPIHPLDDPDQVSALTLTPVVAS